MINQLTEAQIKKMEEYVKRGVEIGLSTKKATLEEAIAIKNSLYKFLGKPAVPVVLLDNPYHAWVAVNLFCQQQVSDQVSDQVWDQVRAQVREQVSEQVWVQVNDQVRVQVNDQVRVQVSDQVWGQVSEQVWNQVWEQVNNKVRNQVWEQVSEQVNDQVWNQVWEQVDNKVRNQVWEQVRNQVWEQVRNQVWEQVSEQVSEQMRRQVGEQVSEQMRAQVSEKSRIMDFIYPYFDGNFFSYYVAWYDFLKNELGLRLRDIDVIRGQLGVGFIYPLDNICVISNNPIEINKNASGLHGELKPAIKYDGNFNVYALNGIRVPEWLAMTSADKLTIEQYNSIQNADIRTEFVRKYGIERMVDMGEIVDDYMKYSNEFWTKSEYKLIDMHCLFEGIPYAPHLYMLNQTVRGVYHLEPVSPECRNLKQAIDEREQVDSSKYKTVWIK